MTDATSKVMNAWVKEHLLDACRPPAGASLQVIYNHDAISLNTVGGQKLAINKTRYDRGLYVHAPSSVLVRLPSPGKSFTAKVGIQSWADTAGGKGSVVFSVVIGGKDAFKSEVLRQGMEPKEVNADLAGSKQFLLNVGDAGDGISHDQSVWAEATVTLEDGKTVSLGGLKLFEPSLPFAFKIGLAQSSAFLASCEMSAASEKLDAARTRHTLVWKDPATGLETRCVAIVYSDSPTVEWTLWFKNAGKENTPAISGIRALEARFTRPQDKGFLVHTIRGSLAQRNDFEPRTLELSPGSTTDFTTSGGRPTSGGWPYWNIEFGSRGVIAVLGWPGQWDARFIRDDSTGLTVSAGMGQFNSFLKPGEEVRSPLALLQFREGATWLDGQNTWRRFYVDHVIPRPGGQVPKPFTGTCVDDNFPGMLSNAAGTIKIMDAYAAHGHKFDYWWTDAGWYETDKDWYQGVGSWTPHPTRWPKGLKEATDHAHKLGTKYIVWFEPERVAPGSWLDKNRPQWLLGKEGGMRLLDLGNDEARAWWTDTLDKFLTEQGIDAYRQDFNIDPLGYWQGADLPGRAGMTEMKYIMGYLSWHDEILKRRPDMLIDTCASGGRRLDIETLRRTVPLLRTDYRFEANGCQLQTLGFSQWITYCGTGGPPTPAWMGRTHMHACFGYGIDTVNADKATWDLMKKIDAEWREIAEHFILGDFHPLTDATLADDAWVAWQYNQAPRGTGVVQVFRHAASPETKMTFRLRGLDGAATYELKDFDKGTFKATGTELMEKGLTVELTGKPDSATIAYRKQ